MCIIYSDAQKHLYKLKPMGSISQNTFGVMAVGIENTR